MITMNHVLYLFPTHKFRWEHRGQTQGTVPCVKAKAGGDSVLPLNFIKNCEFCRNDVEIVKLYKRKILSFSNKS